MDLLIHIKHNLLISNNLDQIWFWKKIPITFSQGCTIVIFNLCFECSDAAYLHTLNSLWIIPGETCQYYDRWCPGPLRHHVINTHGSHNVRYKQVLVFRQGGGFQLPERLCYFTVEGWSQNANGSSCLLLLKNNMSWVKTVSYSSARR